MVILVIYYLEKYFEMRVNDEVSNFLFLDPIKNGEYFWADIQVANKTIDYVVKTDGYTDMASQVMDKIKVMGNSGQVNAVVVNGQAHTGFNVTVTGQVNIWGLGLQANLPFVVQLQ
jgi:hypothetical protein